MNCLLDFGILMKLKLPYGIIREVPMLARWFDWIDCRNLKQMNTGNNLARI